MPTGRTLILPDLLATDLRVVIFGGGHSHDARWVIESFSMFDDSPVEVELDTMTAG